jgi:hypothetical protein
MTPSTGEVMLASGSLRAILATVTEGNRNVEVTVYWPVSGGPTVIVRADAAAGKSSAAAVTIARVPNRSGFRMSEAPERRRRR